MIDFVYELTFHIVCAGCGDKVNVRKRVEAMAPQPQPYCPSGWRALGYHLFCPKHKIDVSIDEKTGADVLRQGFDKPVTL